MIQIFDIKKAKKNLLKANDTEELAEYIKESQYKIYLTNIFPIRQTSGIE